MTRYFTSIVSDDSGKRERQNALREALQTLAGFEIHLGHFLSDRVTCPSCGYTYLTHHEKMTDVNIATAMLTDAMEGKADVLLLVSADSDLVGVIRTLRRMHPSKRVIVAFPPNRHSSALEREAHGRIHVSRANLVQSMFPDRIVKEDGFVLQRPSTWR